MKSPFSFSRLSLPLLLIVVLSAFSVASAQDEYAAVKTWETFDFAGRSVAATDVSALTLDDLKLVRGIVFGKHGRIFKDPDINRFLQSRSWYKADANFQNSALNNTERKNLDVIRIAEAQKHETVQPGDMRLYVDRALTRKKLGTHTNAEWTVIASEIYARHGRIFKTMWIQQYFGGQVWYDPKEDFKDEEISGSDKTNIETIVAYENKLHNSISTKPITQALLQGLFVEDVRKMRDEIYARHGKVFKDQWTQKYFASFDWYKANPNYSDAQLTPVEKGNLAVIAAYEKKAVTAMSTIEG